MVQQPHQFGWELRRRRIESGLTLTQLAGQVHYSKGQLSKVERGAKAPSRELVRLCDAVLAAGGALTCLAEELVTKSAVKHPPESDPTTERADSGNGGEEAWLMQLSADGGSWFRPVGRRQVVTAGAASVLSMRFGAPKPMSGEEGAQSLEVFRSVFDQYRTLGQRVGPASLIPVLIAQTHTLRELSAQADTRTCQGLLRLGSRYAEYIGWLLQETGNEGAALWWTQQAVHMASVGGDRDLAAYALVRRALVALYREDAEQVIGLAQQAQASKLPRRIRGLAAQREAQGHAIAGDYDACMRRMERARTLLAQSEADSETPVIGTTNLADPAAMISGWCLYDLGRPREAAEALDRQLTLVPAGALRTRVRYGVRSALSHAAAGDIDQACALAHQLLDGALTVGSATITSDLRRLERVLARHPRSPAVRALLPELSTSLYPSTS
ncbi:helix-turn-helix domain-containing protein [Peterkaempfera griseoplana]|uniref:helix-turn-helix domain-containing protein n=1 Tax=Peterkaempfera griseoplana TaxID=66896 RepID=UPI0006E3E5D9|nr:helix-turn-helix transcriptional regulator [Peterkaempfera griseoplana]